MSEIKRRSPGINVQSAVRLIDLLQQRRAFQGKQGVSSHKGGDEVITGLGEMVGFSSNSNKSM